MPYVATVVTPYFQSPYIIPIPNARVSDPFYYYYSNLVLTSISPAGFNVSGLTHVLAVTDFIGLETPFSFVSASSTYNLTTGRGLISGVVRPSGQRYILSADTDSYFSAWRNNALGTEKPFWSLRLHNVSGSSEADRPVIVFSPFMNTYDTDKVNAVARLAPFLFKPNDANW